VPDNSHSEENTIANPEYSLLVIHLGMLMWIQCWFLVDVSHFISEVFHNIKHLITMCETSIKFLSKRDCKIVQCVFHEEQVQSEQSFYYPQCYYMLCCPW